MIILIDATNIKAGGGLTHLKRIVEHYDESEDEIIIIGGHWLKKISTDGRRVKLHIYNNYFKNVLKQEWFKFFVLPGLLNKGDVVFIPGGTFSSRSISYISMSQNMLIFEKKERNRFNFFSWMWLKLHLLEWLQLRSFKNSKGIIYISEYAKNYIQQKYPILKNKTSTIIPHGVSKEFKQKPKAQLDINTYSSEKPFVITYVSTVDVYKHHINVISAIERLFNEGYPVKLELAGGIYKGVKSEFEAKIESSKAFVVYKGLIPYNEINQLYKRTNLFVFGSTCENMPNILIEAMSAGLPIVCSSYGPMPEVLKDAGEYIDPINVDSIYKGAKKLILDQELRTKYSKRAYDYASEYSWEKASENTFRFIKQISKENEK